MTAPRDIPELLQPSDYQYYHAIPMSPGLPPPRRDTIEALKKSLDKAHDNLRMAVRQNDHLRLALLKMHRQQKWLLKIFIALMLCTWSVLGSLLKFLLPYAIHGLAK